MALGVGLVLAGSGFASSVRPAENVTLLLMVVAIVVVLVPPAAIRWYLGVLVGGIIAAAFGDVPLPGLALGLLGLVAWTAFESTATSDEAAA